jgi:hypothetical protein
VEWGNYLNFVENYLPSYKHTVDNMVEAATLSNLNTVVAALNNFLSRSAKLASINLNLAPNSQEIEE